MTGKTSGDFRCPGPETALTADHDIAVDVRLLDDRGCAVVSFDGDDRSGYQIRACAAGISVMYFAPNEKNDAGPIRLTFTPFPSPSRLQLAVRDGELTVGNGDPIATLTLLGAPRTGEASLGIWVEKAGDDAARVAFRNIDARGA